MIFSVDRRPLTPSTSVHETDDCLAVFPKRDGHVNAMWDPPIIRGVAAKPQEAAWGRCDGCDTGARLRIMPQPPSRGSLYPGRLPMSAAP